LVAGAIELLSSQKRLNAASVAVTTDKLWPDAINGAVQRVCNIMQFTGPRDDEFVLVRITPLYEILRSIRDPVSKEIGVARKPPICDHIASGFIRELVVKIDEFVPARLLARGN